MEDISESLNVNRVRLRDPTLHAKKRRKKKRDEEKNKSKYKGKQKNKTEASHSFYQAIVPFIYRRDIERQVHR